MKRFGMILSIVFMVVVPQMMTGCGVLEKTGCTATAFEQALNDSGINFNIFDVTDSQYWSEATVVMNAFAYEDGFEMSYLSFSSLDAAKDEYSVRQMFIEGVPNGPEVTSSVDSKNVSYYSRTSNNIYGYVCRVGNTILYVADVPDNRVDEVKEIISSLGY